MPVRLVVAVTDRGWFDHLRRRPDLAEVNFWAPSDVSFKALQPGELFLFKLRAPVDRIVGGGVFAYATTLPCSLAWEAFGEANGAASLPAMRQRIAGLRSDRAVSREDFAIGCRILDPALLPARGGVAAGPGLGAQHRLVQDLHDRRSRRAAALGGGAGRPARGGAGGRARHDGPPRYGEPVLVTPRLGQGAFRVLVTDVYRRRCAVTGERTLPALDAAHIRPYGEGGEHAAPNGLLLRRDVHSLFDAGYVTVTPGSGSRSAGGSGRSSRTGDTTTPSTGTRSRGPSAPTSRRTPRRWPGTTSTASAGENGGDLVPWMGASRPDPCPPEARRQAAPRAR